MKNWKGTKKDLGLSMRMSSREEGDVDRNTNIFLQEELCENLGCGSSTPSLGTERLVSIVGDRLS